MLLKSKKLLSLILIVSSIGLAHASQRVEKADKGDSQIFVSGSEKNRISVEGRNIASAMPGQEGVLVLEKDEVTQALYISFASEQGAVKSATTLFVTDDQNVTYKIVLVQRPISAEEIILVPPVDSLKKEAAVKVADASSNHDRRAKDLLLQMRNYEESSGVEYKAINQAVSLWEEARLVMVGLYYNPSLVGEKYTLTNVSRSAMVMAEQEFYRNGVVGISVEPKQLNSGESATVYVIRERKANE